MQQTVASGSRDRLEDELKLIDELGLAGFFLLHHEVLSLARVRARSARGTGTPRASCLPAGAAARPSARSSATSGPLARRPGRERALARAVPWTGSSRPCRTPTSTSTRDIREKLIVRVTPSATGASMPPLVASFATYRSRGAIRDVGKALGLPYAELERLSRLSDGWDARRVEELARLPGGERKLGSRRWRAFAWLTGEIAGLRASQRIRAG